MHKLAHSALIGGLFALAGASQFAHATNYFSWGAENMTPQWGANGAYTGTATYRDSSSALDCSVAHSGSCSLKIRPTGQGSNESTGVDFNGVPPTYPFQVIGSQLYYRWWMRINSGFSWGDQELSKTKAGRIIRSDFGMAYYTGYIFRNGFRIAECEADAHCLDNQGNSATDNGNIYIPFDMNKMADSKWHEYIVRIKANTSTSCTTPGTCDAEFEAYVDGVSVGSHKNFRLSAVNGNHLEWWGSWMTNPYFQMWSSVSAGGVMYLDDFSTDDKWNSLVFPSGPGTGTGGSPTPLPPASNLTVK